MTHGGLPRFDGDQQRRHAHWRWLATPEDCIAEAPRPAVSALIAIKMGYSLMTKRFSFTLTTLQASAIVLVSVFAVAQLYTAPALAAGSSSSSVPKKKCKKGYVWSKKRKKCVRKTSELLTDDDLYWQARAYVDDGKYKLALDLLQRVKNQNQPRVLNYIGYSTRKLGNVDGGITYYRKALSLDPNYNVAREYLGEGYLQKGDLGSAKQQLAEIAKRCGTSCEEYKDLAEEIAKYEAKGKATSL